MAKPGYSSKKATLPGGRAMYQNMPYFGPPRKGEPVRNRLGQTPAQAARAQQAVTANMLLPDERRYMSPDLGESPTMKTERLEGEALGRARGTTVASRRREMYAHQTKRTPSANMKRFLELKEQRRIAREKRAQRDRRDLSI